MAHDIAAGAVVLANEAYEVVQGGSYELEDLVPCRRRIDTNGAICAFLARSVLGLDEGEAA